MDKLRLKQRRKAVDLQLTYSRQHQDLRTSDSSRTQDHFSSRSYCLRSVVSDHLDAVRFLAFRTDEDFRDLREHGDVQVWPVPHRSQECFGGRTSGTSSDGTWKIEKSTCQCPKKPEILHWRYFNWPYFRNN